MMPYEKTQALLIVAFVIWAVLGVLLLAFQPRTHTPTDCRKSTLATAPAAHVEICEKRMHRL